ncbi:MAG: [FeFe] hydrogenase H-cluster maturation GTPase HydF [Chitinivibrionales bacterium]
MEKTPKSMRVQIGLFGRTNVGKSSFLNMIAGQDIAITSPIPGTTTDVVEKAMELLPIGPVVFLDTAGTDDISELGAERLRKTEKTFDRADVFVLIAEPDRWLSFEETILAEAQKRNTPVVVVVNKIDTTPLSKDVAQNILRATRCCKVVSVGDGERNRYITDFKQCLSEALPEELVQTPTLVGDLVPPGQLAVLIIPIDLQAPKGRLILPQVQTIRDALDNDAATLIVKEREYAHMLTQLRNPPAVSICDSQVVMKMVADTPPHIPCTTFSILFARFKGDLIEEAKGAAAIEGLKQGDRVLIAEACSHHAAEDDIGRVKIPRWLRQYVGCELEIDVVSGRDYPDNLADYSVVIHCGACMLTRREMLSRIHRAGDAGVPVTNYGVCISFLQGVLERVLTPFPAALQAYRDKMTRLTSGSIV